MTYINGKQYWQSDICQSLAKPSFDVPSLSLPVCPITCPQVMISCSMVQARADCCFSRPTEHGWHERIDARCSVLSELVQACRRSIRLIVIVDVSCRTSCEQNRPRSTGHCKVLSVKLQAQVAHRYRAAHQILRKETVTVDAGSPPAPGSRTGG